MALAAPGMAVLRSASANTMLGDLPPSSSVTFLRLLLPAACDDQPADLRRAGEGDLVHVRMGGQRRAGRFAQAGNDVDHALGEAGLFDQLAQPAALSGVCSAGLSTTVQPAARAGPSFQAAINSGKFQGMICPTTPIGSRAV